MSQPWCRVINLPPGARDTLANILLSFVSPGPREPKDLQVYKAIQVDELLLACHYGIPTRDQHNNEFLMRIKVVGHVYDARGVPKMLRTTTSPALVGACWLCWIIGFQPPQWTNTMYSGNCCHVLFLLLKAYACHLCLKCTTKLYIERLHGIAFVSVVPATVFMPQLHVCEQVLSSY